MEDRKLKNGGHFPNELQTLILKAALLNRKEAMSCFLDWLDLNQLNHLNVKSTSFISDFMDEIDLGSQRLMPLVIENLGIDSHPYFPLFTGYKKNLWVRNQRIFLAAKDLLEKLSEEGIPTLLVKGISMANMYYKRIECRPMNDGDILIPYACKSKSLAFFRKQKKLYRMGKKDINMVDFYHASHFFQNKDTDIDIHWNLFAEYANHADASSFAWEGSQEYHWDGKSTRVLSPTHEFFLALIHGRHFGELPPIRWVPDCVMILRKENGKLDWAEFTRLSRMYHFKPYIQKALVYLKDNFWAELPDEMMKEIATMPIKKDELLYYHLAAMNIKKHGFLSMFYLGTRRLILIHRLFENEEPLWKYLLRWYTQKLIKETRKWFEK
jgi:hypothetical protein